MKSTGGFAQAVDLLRRQGLTVGIAESLTGGMVCSQFVTVPGASSVLRGAVVSYATEVKRDVLGVDAGVLAEFGTVDSQVAVEMADGVRTVLAADVGLATTGVAGPGPAEGKESGTVYIAVTGKWGWNWKKLRLPGDRQQVREQAASAVCELLLDCLGSGLLGLPGEKPKLST